MQEKLLNNFIKKFPIVKGKSSQPFIILFDAFTGMGKTTVSQIIIKYIDAIIINNDEIRNFLNDYNDTTNLKEILQRYRLEELLENNNNCIIDSCFSHNFEEKLKYYKNLGYKYYIIRLDCNDEIIKERLKNRTITKINYSKATYDDYLWMKENVKRVPLKMVDFIINTENDVESQVKKLIEKIKEDIKF